MSTALVGHTGFVGSNILRSANQNITHMYNSKNINNAFGLSPDVLIYAGLKAEKYIANTNPSNDLREILKAQENITKINPKKIIFISTIDVYQTNVSVSESSSMQIYGAKEPYGKNRLLMEYWIKNNFKDAYIIRLPALFGKNLKKNFIYDMLHPIPNKLTLDKLKSFNDPYIFSCYEKSRDNHFFELKRLPSERLRVLKSAFTQVGFNSLCFTDSRSVFQFYPLYRLWEDILSAVKHNIHLLNLVTEPISANELYFFIYNKEFKNYIKDDYPVYNFKTDYSNKFNGTNGYIMKKDNVLSLIKNYVLSGRSF